MGHAHHLLFEQCVRALQFGMPQEQALDAISEFFDLRHGAFDCGYELLAGTAQRL
jgi:hypothetical protein